MWQVNATAAALFQQGRGKSNESVVPDVFERGILSTYLRFFAENVLRIGVVTDFGALHCQPITTVN